MLPAGDAEPGEATAGGATLAGAGTAWPTGVGTADWLVLGETLNGFGVGCWGLMLKVDKLEVAGAW